MWRLTLDNFAFIGLCLEGFLYGIYSGIFIIYLQCKVSKKDTHKSQNVIFYSICILYVLSVPLFVSDVAVVTPAPVPRISAETVLHIYIAQNTLFGCCNFIAQFILIYRCWIVWRRNIRVIIIPSVLAITFLVVWLVPNGTQVISNEFVAPYWAEVLSLSGLALSLSVNALVTSLIIFRIFNVFRVVRGGTSDDQILGATGGNKLRDIIFILIESGTAFFAIQLVRLVLGIVGTQETADVIIGIHEMITGITPTFILVRTSMGLSFDEDKSMEEVAMGSLRFMNHLNSVPEMGSTNVEQENDIEVVER